MTPETVRKRCPVCILLLLSIIVISLAFPACADGSKPTPPSQGDGNDNRYCSFEITNINDTFDLNKIEYSVNFGVNSANVADYKAAFSVFDVSGGESHVLYAIENLAGDDFSFTHGDNGYEYKKTVMLEIESDYFADNQGTIQLEFCLYERADEDYTNAATGYAYKIDYTKTENNISFVSDNGFVIRHP